jgi:hypothetical protein
MRNVTLLSMLKSHFIFKNWPRVIILLMYIIIVHEKKKKKTSFSCQNGLYKIGALCYFQKSIKVYFMLWDGRKFTFMVHQHVIEFWEKYKCYSLKIFLFNDPYA